MTPAFPRTARPRRGWPGSTRARWARSATVRSGCRSARSPMPPPARCPGGCFCPSAGTTPRPRRRGGAAGGAGARGGRRRAPPRPRRTRAGIPAEERRREKWRLALDMLDELADWGLAPPVVVADAGYGANGEFRDGLSARGRAWVVQVNGELTAHPADAVPERIEYSGRGPRPKPRYRTK